MEFSRSAFVVGAVLAFFVADGACAADRFAQTVSKAQEESLEHAMRSKDQVVALQDLVDAQPAYFRAWYNLGLAQARRGQIEEAVKSLERARHIRDEQHLNDTTIYNSLGWLYLQTGRYKQAQESLSVAVASPQDPGRDSAGKAYNNLGLAFWNLGKYKDAKDAFKKAVGLGSALAGGNLKRLPKNKDNED